MRAGNFDRRILIEKKQITNDPTYGNEIVTWVPIAGYYAGSPQLPVLFWAQVQDVMPSKSEAVSQNVVVGRIQTRIRMRWRTGINSSMRITVYGDVGDDQVFQIVGGPAMVYGRKQVLEVVCERFSS